MNSGHAVDTPAYTILTVDDEAKIEESKGTRTFRATSCYVEDDELILFVNSQKLEVRCKINSSLLEKINEAFGVS